MKALWFGSGICFLMVPAILPAQNENAAPVSIFEYLTQREGDTLCLQLDLQALLAKRRTKEYGKAVLTDAGGRHFPVEVRCYGKFRRMKSEIPPVKLKFSKKKLLAARLDTLNEVKLVLPFTNDEKGGEALLGEYICYRMYERLTPLSYRARLVNLRLCDNHGNTERLTYALLLEHEEELLARLRAQTTDQWNIPAALLHQDQTALMIRFQYLIGNTDWDISSQRNVVLLQQAGNEAIVPVPYDFDFAGMVGATYASPNSDTGLKSIQDRCLMSYGTGDEALDLATLTIKAAEQDLYSLCKSKWLPRKASARMTAYLKSYFREGKPACSIDPIKGK